MSTAARVEERSAKPPSTLKSNVKNLTQGFRTVMTSNRLSQKSKEKDKTTPDDSEDSDTFELHVDDLPPSARETGDEVEASMDLTEFATGLRTSKVVSAPQDSPRSPEELQGGPSIPLSFQGNQSLVVGSDSNLIFNNNQKTQLSPVPATASSDAPMKYPSSAPAAHGLSPGISPARGSQVAGKNGKFLRGKIKISALKNFVGTGLDLGGGNNNSNNNHHATKLTPRGSGNKDGQELLDFLREEMEDDTNVAAPSTAITKGTGIAKKMRKSIMGFKNLAKSTKNAPVLLDDDNTESTDFRLNEDANDAFSVEDSIPSASEIAQFTHEKIEEEEEKQQQQQQVHSSKESLLQEKLDAKQRRREKHHQRRSRQLDGDSSHASAVAASLDASEGPSLQRKNTKTKLDSQARERLKKHSEGREFRTASRTVNRRMRQQMLSNHNSDKCLETKNEDSNNAPGLSPVTLSKAPLVRTSSEPVTKRAEALSGRKREDTEKLRERVRAHNSFITANRPKKEPSLSLMDVMNQDDDDDDESAADETASFHSEGEEEETQPSADTEDSDESPNSGQGEENSSGKSNTLLDSCTSSGRSLGFIKPSSGHSDGHDELSCQHVESARSNDYLQLVIGDVPPKSASPIPDEEAEPHIPPSPHVERGKKITRKPSRRRLLQDASASGRDSSQTRRSTKGSFRGQGEKTEPNIRRKPRSERTNHHRHADRSPRRKSDNIGVRRRRAPVRNEAGHMSEPVLSAEASGVENEDADAMNDANDVGAVEVSSRSHLGESSAANYDTSAQGSVEGGCHIRIDRASGHACATEAAEMKDSKRHDGKDSRRRHHHKGVRDRDISKKLERKLAKSILAGGTRHSIGTSSCSTSKTNKLHRSKTTDRNEGASKKAPSRGRSERQRDQSRDQSNPERTKGRRHSTDAKRRGESEGKSARGSSEGRVPDLMRHSVERKRGSNESEDKSAEPTRRHSVDSKKRGSNESEGKAIPKPDGVRRISSVDGKRRGVIEADGKEPEANADMVVARETGAAALSRIKW